MGDTIRSDSVRVGILHVKVSIAMTEINQVLEQKKNMVNEKATKFRETRDEWNKKSKTHSTPGMN